MTDEHRKLIDPGLPARLSTEAIQRMCETYSQHETATENLLYRCLAQLERLQSARKTTYFAPKTNTINAG